MQNNLFSLNNFFYSAVAWNKLAFAIKALFNHGLSDIDQGKILFPSQKESVKKVLY